MSERRYKVSVSGATYDRVQAYSLGAGKPKRAVVERLVNEIDTMTPEQQAALAGRVRQSQGIAARRRTVAAKRTRASR